MKNRKALLLMTMLSVVFAVIMPTSIYALDPETNQETSGETTPSPTPSPSPSEEPTPSPSPSESPVTKTISLDKTSLELVTNKSFTLVATVTPSGSEIEWSSSDEEVAKVSENGKVTTLSKAGTTTITATIKGTTIKASCTIKVTKAVGSDATLKKLVISNGTLDKEFKSDVYNYSVTLDTSVNKLEFTYELSDSNASYFGPSSSANKNLKNGDKLELKVVAEDGTNHTYTLTIVKDASNLNLKSLKINGYALNEVFDYNTLHYTASIPYEVDTITVAANPIDNAANVDITGLTNLKVGENTVTITVSDKAGNSKKYTIIVTRESEKTVSENPTSIITSTSSNPTSSIINSNSNNKSDDSFLKYLIVSIACFILFLIGGIGIYFYMKTSPKKIKNELKNLNNGKKQQESPILEVGNEKQEALKEVMNEDLMKTKEFSKEELIDKEETENLFDEEDV